MITDSDWRDFEEHVKACMHQAPVLGALMRAELAPEELPAVARRFYAEVRTFVDHKLPARMRLCPHDAAAGKKYFWEIYQEEQGEFVSGQNHAAWFKAFCLTLGLSEEELEEEYSRYWPRYSGLLTEEPSTAAMIREMAISYAWESVIVVVGPQIINVLKNKFGFADEQLSYFQGHLLVDEGHSDLALAVLKTYVTGPETMALAREAVHHDLVVAHSWLD